ncbi:MAG TPA: hypothetical protein VHN36_01060 [Ilumatobacteraceae bacterium]|nr:hypothetical protein [Ilumatobacteraceae bacterium]
MAHQISRKDFLLAAVGLIAAGAAVQACGSDGAASGSPDSAAALSLCAKDGAKDGGIDDPLHHLVVPAADIKAGVSKTYSIKGQQTHDHKVTLEVADFANLATDSKVTVRSTSALSHSHTFEVVCA